jgi:hypothetical protein
MTSKGIIAYYNSQKILVKRLAAFNIFSILNMVMQGFGSFFITLPVMSKVSSRFSGSNGPIAFDKKSNTNMHNYGHTLLHNLLPGRS